MTALPLAARVATRLDLPLARVTAALTLLDEGATVPFVARYRKERTGGLDEVQLRAIAEHGALLTELDQRRETIFKALTEQGKLTPALQAALQAAESRTELEELYAPYKRKRKTRADTARERGLAPLAERILSQSPSGDPRAEAARFVDASREVPDIEAALAGARDIVAEALAVEHTGYVRTLTRDHGVLSAKLRKGADPEEAAKFRDYADFQERIGRIPSHRYLAVCRAEAAGVLTLGVRPDPARTRSALVERIGVRRTPYAEALRTAAEDSLDRLMLPSAERSVRSERKELADAEAIDVFATNLGALLLAPPFGPRPVVGIDPGIRTGCKCASVSATGAVRSHQVMHLVGRDRPEQQKLAAWLRAEAPDAVAVGNGTGGREALAVVREAVRDAGLDIPVVSIAETGASVYSASDVAREELPDLDLTVRSAVHLARRLQDPLAELVKVPPASLGVGQYQHDVDAGALERRLHDVVESCVNRVGVDANTASAALLRYVAGIGPKLADAVVAHRQQHGPFASRRALLDVKGLGARTFEQCAGFLRIRSGADPLDATGVHPERAKLVARMARDHGTTVAALVGNADAVAKIDLARYQDDEVGRATLLDIAAELARPGHDPREAFEAPSFREDVRTIEDLAEGMVLEGVVTNVTAFGAFVDLGVHQDGLVHVSELSDRYVRTPSDVVSPGQRITVRVLGVDLPRKRISLSAKRG